MIPTPSEPIAEAPVLVIGSTTTALRLVEELERAGERAVVLVPPGAEPWMVEEMRAKGADVHAVSVVREGELRAAGVEHAKAAVVLGQEEVSCLRIALALEELAPDARLVLEMGNPEFADKLGKLLGHVVVLSSADLAAPSFVAAALAGGQVQSFEIAGRMVVAGTKERVGGERLAVLGDSSDPRTATLLARDGDIVLGTEVVGSAPTVRRSGLVGALSHVFDRRLRWVLGILLALMVISTLYFRFVAGLDWLMSLYVALTAATLTGIGDIEELSLGARFGGVVIQLFGVVLSSGITAVIVDALISARISDLAGGVRGRPRGHVVVCGLGRVGKEVALRLKARGVAVVAIERDETSRGVLAARAAKIPVIIGEASDRTILQQANIRDAESVMAITDNDAVNLEIALTAKDARPDLRVVTRLFDQELAERVEKRLELGATRSVSMLAAPTFAAVALGRRREQVVSVGRRVLIFTELTIQHGSTAERGIATSQLDGEGVRLLALRRAGDEGWTWNPAPCRLKADDKVAVAATRVGLARLLRTIKRPGSAAAASHRRSGW